MVVPDNYAITIVIGGTDVTSDVPYNSCSMELYQRRVSTFSCQINNPATPPVKDDRVKIYNATQGLIFSGYVTRLRQKKRDNGVETIYEVECADDFIRLQNSVIDFCESTNSSEQDVLTDLLGCTFPDLTSEFDFTSGVNSVLDNLNFEANNLSLADALKDFSDSVGRREWSLKRPLTQVSDVSESGVHDTSQPPPRLSVVIEPTNTSTVGTISFETVITDAAIPNSCLVTLFNKSGNAFDFIENKVFTPSIDGSRRSFSLEFSQTNVNFITIEIGWVSSGDPQNGASYSYTIENVNLNGKPAVDWNSDRQAPFDLDINNSDEFGSDFELDIGDYDDFNSVTVTGGYESVEIDWTYENEGREERINLETKIDDIQVFKPDGLGGWIELSVGVWGVDDLGSKQTVVYDSVDHWLYFSNPVANSDQAIRVTGTIRKPIRVRVNNYSDGDVISATTYHNENISSEQQAVDVGLGLLDQQQTIKNLKFKTYNPGLLPGQELNVTDSNAGIDETLVIQSVRVSWIGSSGHAEFEIECGNKQEDSADVIMARNSKKANEVDVPPGTIVKSVEFLIDSDGNNLTDSDGNLLYTIDRS